MDMLHLSRSSKHITRSFTSIVVLSSFNFSRSIETAPAENENALLAAPKIPDTAFTPFLTISFPLAFA